LELDLATRARKPIAVFYDERFRAYLDLPPGIHQQPYDAQEVRSRGRAPSERRHQLAFASFGLSVTTAMAHRAQRDALMVRPPAAVGLLLPGPEGGYDDPTVAHIAHQLADRGYRTERPAWPPRLTAGLVGALRQFDWVVVDVSDTIAGATTLAFLHGHAIPMLRLRHLGSDSAADPQVERALFGGFDVGYCEDLLAWRTQDQLLEELAVRLDRLDEPVRRISTHDEAETYFNRARLRKEQIFVSYASQDSWAATAIAAELRGRFQRVFDYRDGGASLPPGSSWMSEVYGRLRDSQIGLSLLSRSYVAKRTCTREAEQMMIRADQENMRVFPLNLDGVEPPDFMATVQFRRFDSTSDVVGLVDDIVAQYDSAVSTE
jgi:hypothetical protein